MSPITNPFNHPDFKSWVNSLKGLGAKVSTVVTFPDGKVKSFGDTKHRFDALKKKKIYFNFFVCFRSKIWGHKYAGLI